MAKYKTTVTEKDGTTSSGYIENGRSYYDNGKEINAGASVVDAQGKTWTKGGTTNTSNNAQSEIDMINAAIRENNSNSGNKSNYGSYSTSEITYNPYEDYTDYYKQAYQDLEDKIREQNRLAVEQGTNRLNAQKDTINQAAEDNARQAYIMQMQAKKALPQQLVSQGATGGTTETANLGIQTTYQNTLNDINRNKVNAIQEIDNAIVDLKNTGNLATVEQVLANNQAMLDAYMTMLDKGVSYNQWANQYNANRTDAAYEQGYQERAYQDALKQQAYENELDMQASKLKAQEAAEKQVEKAKDNYNSIYKEAKNLWEAGNVSAEEINNWLAMQDLTDAEHEQIITSLGVKAILDNLDRLGKLSY